MKHLTNFLSYLKESNEIDDNEVEKLLLPFSDIGIKYSISKPKLYLLDDKYKGRKYKTIDMAYKGNIVKNVNKVLGYKDDIWDFLYELVSFRDKLSDDDVYIDIRGYNNDLRIYISYFISEEVENSDTLKLTYLHNSIKKKRYNTYSNFANSMTSELENDVIKINCSSDYTMRKWKLFMREFDLSEYDVSIIQNDDSAKIEIKLKK